MIVVSVELFSQRVRELLEAAQQERVLVTRDGEPYAMVVGVGHKDREDLELEMSPEFWEMIRARRRDPTVPLEEVEAEIRAEELREKEASRSEAAEPVRGGS